MSASSRPLIDPELVDVLDVWAAVELTAENLEETRALWRIPVQRDTEAADALAVKMSTCWVDGVEGAPRVPVRVYEPSRIAGGVGGGILHVHGGGYVGGEAAMLQATHRDMAAKLGCVLASVDYRLAPETRFPGNIEDCYAALSWFFAHACELGIDPQRIGVMGESAGGGLAATLALLARDRGEFSLAFQHLIYPMLDDRTCIIDSDPHPFTGEFVWTRQNNWFGWSALLGAPPGSSGVSPYASPARADRLEGLPPTFISTAALDLFLEEDMQYARRLLRAGVPVELHVYPGAFHGFDQHPTATVARVARRHSLEALARFLGPPPRRHPSR